MYVCVGVRRLRSSACQKDKFVSVWFLFNRITNSRDSLSRSTLSRCTALEHSAGSSPSTCAHDAFYWIR